MEQFRGFYLDTDYQMFRSFNLLNYQIVLPRESDDDAPIYLGNAVFASRPGHPFWSQLLDDLFRRFSSRAATKTEEDVLSQTGPGAVTATLKTHFETDSSIYIPPRNDFHPKTPSSGEELERIQASPSTYGVHWCFGRWRGFAPRKRWRGWIKRFLSLCVAQFTSHRPGRSDAMR
jgi:mannosyltransferase OCH1-like enzyme